MSARRRDRERGPATARRRPRHAPAPRVVARPGRPATVAALWNEGLDELRTSPRASAIEPGHARTERWRAVRRRGRRCSSTGITDGWVRDGHGDLLADDVFALDDGPRILDCIAFDDRLRHGDVLLDIAFLAMDLERRGHLLLAEAAVAEWSAALAEDHPSSLRDHYVAYRAHVRSKVAAIRASQGTRRPPPGACAPRPRPRPPRARTRAADPGRGAPGDGEVHPRRRAGARDRSPGPPLGRPPQEHGRGASGDGGRGAVREGALPAGDHGPRLRGAPRPGRASAEPGRDGRAGRLLDPAPWRRDARRLARLRGAGIVELRCEVPGEVARARMAARGRAGGDPSDATPDVADRMHAAADPWPEAIAMDTRAAAAEVVAAARTVIRRR